MRRRPFDVSASTPDIEVLRRDCSGERATVKVYVDHGYIQFEPIMEPGSSMTMPALNR